MTFPLSWFVTLFLFWNSCVVVKIAHSKINGAGDTHVKAARMLFRKLELILWRGPIDVWFIWHLPLRSNKNRNNLLVLKNLSLITFFFFLFGFRFLSLFPLTTLKQYLHGYKYSCLIILNTLSEPNLSIPMLSYVSPTLTLRELLLFMGLSVAWISVISASLKLPLSRANGWN